VYELEYWVLEAQLVFIIPKGYQTVKDDMRRYLIALILVAVSMVAGIVFYLIFHQPEEPMPAPEGAKQSGPPAAVNGAVVNLYFADNDRLFLTAESRTVPNTKDPSILGRHIIEALIRGPQKGLARTVPEAAALRAIYITENGRAYVDLKDGIMAHHPGGSKSELMTIYSIVNSLVLNVPAIHSVKIIVEGRESMSLAGHIDLRYPFKANMLIVR